MKKRRTLSISLAFILAVGMLAGCTSPGSAPTSNPTAAAGEATKEPADSTASGNGAEAADAAYVPTKEVAFTYWWMNDADIPSIQTPIENVPDQWLRERTKAYVQEGFGNGGMSPNVKLETMIAAGTVPDFGVTYNFEGFDRSVEAKQAYGMTPELIQKYAPHAWEIVPEQSWKVMTRDGRIYGIPGGVNVDYVDREAFPASYFEFYATPVQSLTWTMGGQFFAIRDDIVKQLFPEATDFNTAWEQARKQNKPVPEMFVLPVTSTEAFVKVFYDIKALNLMENGKPVYPFGFVQGDNWMSLTALGGEMIGYKGMEYMTVYNQTQNKLEFGFDLPMVKEAAKIQNQMIRDSVIDPESIVHTIEKYREKYLNGQYAIVCTMGGNMIGYSGFDTLNAELEKAGKSYRYIPFYTQVPNLPDYPMLKQLRVAGACSQFYIPMVTMDEEKLIQWLNWVDTQFTQEWDEVRYWGPESAGLYTTGEDGLRKFVDEKLQKAIIEGDTDIDWRECKGLLNYNRANNCNFTISPYASSLFNPGYLYRDSKPITQTDAFCKFSFDSPYAQNIPVVPAFQSWAPDYAHLPQVNEMFKTRSVWEDAYKLALVAKDEAEFEAKWAAANKIMHDSFDVQGLLDGQTPIFQENQKQLKDMGITVQ